MRKEVQIVNKLGLHARPAAIFVRWVTRLKSTVTIWKGEENFSAASLLEVLTANLDCGARVVLEAIGPDEKEAIDQLERCYCVFAKKKVGAHKRVQFVSLARLSVRAGQGHRSIRALLH